MVQLFYNSSESVTRAAKVRVLCRVMLIWVADIDQSSFAMNLLSSA